jgi:hypothetical protein
MSKLEVSRETWEDSLAHTQHPVNFFDAKPMENIGHQRLESHVLHTSNVLGSLEILRGPIQSALSGIVDKVLQQGIRKQLGKKDKSKVGRRVRPECMGVWGKPMSGEGNDANMQ